MSDDGERRGPTGFFGRRMQRPVSPAAPERPASRPPRHPASLVDGSLSPADSFTLQCVVSRPSGESFRMVARGLDTTFALSLTVGLRSCTGAFDLI